MGKEGEEEEKKLQEQKLKKKLGTTEGGVQEEDEVSKIVSEEEMGLKSQKEEPLMPFRSNVLSTFNEISSKIII